MIISHRKNPCKCAPDEVQLPEVIELSEAVFIPCKFCGYSVLVRRKGDFSKIKKLTGIEKKRFEVNQKDWEEFQEKITKHRASQPEISKRDLLFEMLADGDIDMDTFNNQIVKTYA